MYNGFSSQFYVLLPPLYELILEIERNDIRGGQLLNLLHKRCHCGVPELQTCIQRYVSDDYVMRDDVFLGCIYIQLSGWP